MKDEALRLALEALEYNDHLRGEAITAIKQALAQPEHSCIACEGNPKGKNNPCNVCGLAQPEPEPRAWIDRRVHAYPDCFVMQPDPPHTSPLYTSLPKRKPLTNGEIYTAYITATNQTLRAQDERLAFAFARAIEAAHGIKGEA